MAAGSIPPYSAEPKAAGSLFKNVHVGAGSYSKKEAGLGVAASIASDQAWELRFQMPPTLPSGTCKLLIKAMANATSGAAKVNPKWASVANGEDPSSAVVTAEGTTTLTWSTGDADDYKETKVDLDADTVVAGETIVMDLTFESTGWTLAVVSTWNVFVIWE